MRYFNISKRSASFILLFSFFVTLTCIWYFTFPSSEWEKIPNYLMIYIQFVSSRPLEAFLLVNTGPGAIISWVSIPAYLTIFSYIFLYIHGKRNGEQYAKVSKRYLVFLIILGAFAISFQNVSQHYNWYWNPKLNVPSYIDIWTHILSPLLLGALIAPIRLERYLGLDERLKWLPIITILLTASFLWEIGETLALDKNNEAGFYNYPMDSLKDIILGGVITPILVCWIYERLVMDFDWELPEHGNILFRWKYTKLCFVD